MPAANPLVFGLKPDEILARTDALIAAAKAAEDRVGALSGAPGFGDVFLPLANAENDMERDHANATFWQYVHGDKDVRDASSAADKKLRDYGVESGLREDVYSRVKEALPSAAGREPEEARLAEKIALDFKRNGLDLSAEAKEKMKEIKKRMAELSIAFSKNVNEDKTERLFTREQLEGMPEDFLSGLKMSEKDGVTYYHCTMKYPEIIPIQKLCKVDATRREMDLANSTRCRDNVEILTELVKLRKQAANLLGYKTHADFKLEVKMAKTTSEVMTFLGDLTKLLRPLAEQEMTKLLSLKKAEKEARGEPFDGKINSWDVNYYNNILLTTEYQVDNEAIKPYFPMEAVTTGMLELYEELFSIKCVEVPNAETWHPDVRLFEVFDAESGELCGQFYLDLHPRDNKYTHAACFGLVPGHTKADGTRQHPVAAMVANFTKSTPERPSLLLHNEVVTYFHELGHVFHQILSKTKFARFHGTAVERDFVEAPSQLLENWCYEYPILKRLSKHYKTGEPIPESLAQPLAKSKNVLAGLLNLRQAFFATYDMKIHSIATEEEEANLDLNKLWEELRPAVSLIEQIPGTYPVAVSSDESRF